MDNDTISAISTPIGQGAIGLIRISGKDAFNILKRIFKPKGILDLDSVPTHTVHFGYILENGNQPLDEVLVTIMRAPHTYTKEDMVEISCHGSPIVLNKVLHNVINAGARLAEPGEFTKRAFLNGRLDLNQAEAVAELINAKTEESARVAFKHLKGDLSIYIKSLQHIIKEIVTSIEANVDFPEEDIPEPVHRDLKERLEKILFNVKKLISTYENGVIINNGINVAIVGKTNVGKSSLFNILVEKPRAIITPIPGTTRDFIEEFVNINGKLFKFIDTAGWKVPKGVIEEETLKLTKRCIEDSAVILFLIDGSKPLVKKDLEIWDLIVNKPKITIINKIDLLQKLSIEKVKRLFNTEKFINISCKENTGIDELKSELIKISNSLYNPIDDSEIIITNTRHKNVLEKVENNIKDAIAALENNLSIEFVAYDLKLSMENLQELTGERISDTILEDIFSKFCIGK